MPCWLSLCAYLSIGFCHEEQRITDREAGAFAASISTTTRCGHMKRCCAATLKAMSQSLEPEQVMLLLHELFTKYDQLSADHGWVDELVDVQWAGTHWPDSAAEELRCHTWLASVVSRGAAALG
jgi:hypothetical protein